MENRFKLKLPKIFQSTFNSCRPKHNSDVAERHVSFLENPHHRRLVDLFSPKPRPLSSTSCNPKPKDNLTPISVSPTHEKASKRGRKRNHITGKEETMRVFRRSQITITIVGGVAKKAIKATFKTLCFSRRSFSTESLESVRKSKSKRSGGGGVCEDREAADVVAVAKESSDPHEDFKASMVDIIVEKGIFGVEELEKLVECFLSLNSEEHHKVILRFFAEIWETLVSKSDLYKK